MPPDDRRFIDRRLSILLDLVRAGAALMVLVGHAGSLGFFGPHWPFDGTFQHAPVVVFFVLSGLMIQQSAARPGMTLGRFARARVARIVPVALFALVFATALFVVMVRTGLPVPESDHYNDGSTRAIVMPLLFLSERMDGIGPPINPPFWSLCYEIWFYAIFGLFRFGRGWLRVAGIVAAMMLADAPILLLLPTWLVGVAISAHGSGWRPARPRLVIALSMAGFALSQWSGLPPAMERQWAQLGLLHLRFSAYFLTDLVGAACIAGAIVALRATRGDPARLEAVARRYAGISFTLYLTHWPVLLIVMTGLRGGPIAVGSVAALLVPVLFARLLAPVLEGRLPRLLRGRGAPPVMTARQSAGRNPSAVISSVDSTTSVVLSGAPRSSVSAIRRSAAVSIVPVDRIAATRSSGTTLLNPSLHNR
jgi:peptidoglycan/LPS O-acetylase OafA/YrhL